MEDNEDDTDGDGAPGVPGGIGGRISLLLVAVVVVSLAASGGTVLYYQDRLEEVESEAERRGDRIDELEGELETTRENLSEARLELRELRGIAQEAEALRVKNEDLKDVVTGDVESATEAERERERALDRLDRLEGEYSELLDDYRGAYAGCERAPGCNVSSDWRPPTGYNSTDGFRR